MPHAVRCPSCGGLSRVADDALGLAVACPHCGAHSVAGPAPPVVIPRAPRNPTLPTIPTVSPRRKTEPEFAPDQTEERAARRPVAGAVGLALLPLGIPLAWLVAPLLGLGRPIFSFAAPVALALGLVGLGLGVAHCYGWSVAARLRTVVVLVVVGYAIGLVLFLVNTEWAVAVRRNLPAPAGEPLVKFTALKGTYSVTVPGRPEQAPLSPITGWELDAYRAGPRDDRRDTFLQLVYEFASGFPPTDIRFEKAEAFYPAVRSALAESTGGEVTAKPFVEWKSEAGGRYTRADFAVALPDGARRRVVRVIHDERRGGVFYLAVEGAFLPDDLREVRAFFRSLQIPAK